MNVRGGPSKAEHQSIDAFELWCWRKLLRVPWTARRSNYSILKEISIHWKWLMLKLKLQFFGHLMWRAKSLEKTWLGKIGDKRRREATKNKMVGWHHRLNGHESEQILGDGEGQGSLACCSPWGHKELDTTEQRNNNHSKLPWMAEKRVQFKWPTQQTSERGTKETTKPPLRALGLLQWPLTVLLGLNLNVFFNILVYEGFIDYHKINDVTLKNIFSLSSF